MKQEPLPVILIAADAAKFISHALSRLPCHRSHRLALFRTDDCLHVARDGGCSHPIWPLMTLTKSTSPTVCKVEQRPWLGTDSWGETPIARIVFGARTAFQVAIGAVFLGAFFGIPIGAVAGFGGRWVDAAVDAPDDAIIAFPAGCSPSLYPLRSAAGFILSTSLGINSIPSYARSFAPSSWAKGKGIRASAAMTGDSELSILFFKCCRIACHRSSSGSASLATRSWPSLA